MITWNEFIYFAIPAVLLWTIGAWSAWKDRSVMANILTCLGLLVFFSFIVLLWISLECPPLRTMGETRLWYSAFLPLAGIIVYVRWRYKWILTFSTVLALVFICINLLRPEIHNKTLMPALQSPWFAPHVIIYMFCYAILGVATLVAVASLVQAKRASHLFPLIDNLVYVGLSFMTIGMLFGALWAKEAWGHYWAWDPKETWAALTWFAYLGYVHLRRIPTLTARYSFTIIIIAFCLLQMCWWGINYLPSAQGMSVHTYSTQ